ncbi:MAG: ATP-binding cassette domain-containing protein [Pseudomonadota bacterium]
MTDLQPDTAMDRPQGPCARPTMLACRDLWKVFGATPDAFRRAGGEQMPDAGFSQRNWVAAVRTASIEVAKGEVFVIMGLSGSGKSTLIRCLTRLVEPTAGSVIIDGVDLLAADPQALIEIRRRTMGMVFQHFALLPHRDVLGNVAFPLQAQGRARADRIDRAREMIDLVGLTGREDRFPGELSGGQQQRVGIARSLVTDPPVWFLDEPFSALDPLIRTDLQDELLRLQAQLSKTVIFITHDLEEAIKIADRIAIMESGRIVQIGTPEDLVLRPADDYVARFTSKVPPAKVVRAGTLAEFGQDAPDGTGDPVDGDLPLETIAVRVVEHDGVLAVRDAVSGRVGVLDRQAALKVIAGQRPAF